MHRTILFLFLVTFNSYPFAGEPFTGELSFSRANFGYSKLPIWSKLTDFEERTISTFEDNANSHSLLSLYIIASGEVRTQREFNAYESEFEAWLSDINRDFRKSKDKLSKGDILFTTMHERFFPSREFSGYNADQSQLNHIFDNKTYNCISSAMLYMAAARKLNLSVSGVLIPSHAFVQLNLDKNKSIDIETTSKDGFNIQHDAEFYQNQVGSWSSDRNLEPPTYSDYLDRKIITPLELGLLNMWSQHTSAERMSYKNRLRLAEIRSHLSPTDINAHTNRISLYLVEFSHMDAEKEYTLLHNMFKKIEPFIEALENSFSDNLILLALTSQLRAGHALTLMRKKEFDKGLDFAKEIISRRIIFNPMEEQTENILFYSLDLYTRHLVADQNFEKAQYELLLFEPDCHLHSTCRQSLINVYNSWAQYYWVTESWQEVLQVLTAYPSLDVFSEGNESIRSNLMKAYSNLAQEQVYDGDWKLGLETLQTCLDYLPEAALCKESQDDIYDRRQKGYL